MQTYSDFTLNSTLKLFIKVKLCKDVLLLLAHEGPERHVSCLARRCFACARICFGLVRARKAHNNCKFTKVNILRIGWALGLLRNTISNMSKESCNFVRIASKNILITVTRL